MLKKVFVILTLLLGVIGILVYENYQYRKIQKEAGSNITVSTNPQLENLNRPPNDKEYCAYKDLDIVIFKDINNYIDQEVCNNKYKGWKTASSPNLFSLKHPDYYMQDLSWGQDSFKIRNQTFGEIDLSTFIHDFFIPDNSFSEKICTAMEIGHLSKDPSIYSYYKDSLGQYYIISDLLAVIAEDKTENVWGFYLVDQQSKNESKLMSSDDFKCFVRSIELTN